MQDMHTKSHISYILSPTQLQPADSLWSKHTQICLENPGQKDDPQGLTYLSKSY